MGRKLRGLRVLNIRTSYLDLRSRQKTTSDFWRSDLGEICVIRLSKTGGITGYFEDFVIEERSKMAQR